MKYAFASSLALVISVSSFSQKGKEYLLVDSVNYETLSKNDKYVMDSLLPLYHKATHDTARLRILETLEESLNDESVWPRYNNLMYSQSKKHLEDSSSLSPMEIKAYKKYFATALQNFGYAAQFSGTDLPKALDFYSKCLKIQEEIGDKHGTSSTLNNIGLIYNDQGYIGKALEYFFRSLKIDEEINNKSGMGYSLNSIASIYLQQGDTAKGIEYTEKSLKIREETGDKRGCAISMGSMGSLYNQRGDKEKALSYFKKAMNLWKDLGEKRGLAISYQDIGKTYLAKANSESSGRDSLYAMALDYLQKGLKLSEEIKDKYGLSQILVTIGNCYLAKKNIAMAEHYGNLAMNTAKELKSPNALSNVAQFMLKIYRLRKNWEDALKMHELYIQMRDSLFNQETQKSTFKQQMKYEFEKQQAVKDAEHQKALAVAEEEKKRQRIITYSTGLGLGMVVLFSIFIFNRLRITRKQKLIIEEQKKIVDQKNKHITDSINYAKRIQDAILPSRDELSKHFPDHFIFFRPREIVSGDFYWLSNQNGKTILAIADCTGHGVPGAFMSMIGNTLLNEIVNEKNIYHPSEILNHLQGGIVQSLHQESRSQDDGMDISVCLFDKEKNKITFAGANHSMYVVQHNSIREIKGDIYSIGSIFGKKHFSFTQQEIALPKNSSVYFSTDGFADQVGGKDGKKFLVKQLEKLFLSVSALEINEQEEKIKKTFEEWKGNYSQLDDVLVAGIKT